jgi:hypothetical protein
MECDNSARAEAVPRTSLVIVGIIAVSIAFVSLLTLMSFIGNDTILIVGDHLVGGTSDKLAAGGVSILSGAVAVFTVLRSRRRPR